MQRYDAAMHTDRSVLPMTISALRSEAQGLVARFSLVLTKKKNDNIRVARVAVERLYQHAESILPAATLSLKGEVDTWANLRRLANAVVIACDRAEPAPTVAVGEIQD